MKHCNRSIAVILVLSMMGLLIPPETAFSSGSRQFAQADNKQITRHAPRLKAVSAVQIPMEKKSSDNGGISSKWLLIGLGVAAALGLVMAAGGGGGGGDETIPQTSAKGNVNVAW